MAKKKKEESTELVIIETAEFAEIIKQSPIELTKAQAHAVAFQPLMIQYHEQALVLSKVNKADPSAEDVKLCFAARNKMVKIRTAAGEVKDERKEHIKIEDRLIMSLHNTVIDTCKLTEAEFKEIETFAERKETERLDTLEEGRNNLLLEVTDEVNEFVDIRNMDDSAFSKYLENQKLLSEAKKTAEATRIANESKAAEEEAARLATLQATADQQKAREEKYTKRLNKTISVGMIVSEDSLVHGDTKYFTLDELRSLDDKKFDKIINAAEKVISGLKKAEEIAAQKVSDELAATTLEANKIIAGQYQSRCNIARAHLLSLGYVDYPDNEFMKHGVFEFVEPYFAYNELASDDVLQAFLSDHSKIVNEAIDKENKAIARKAELAPDKDKIREFATKFKDLVDGFPAMKTKDGESAKITIVESLEMIKAIIKDQYQKLK